MLANRQCLKIFRFHQTVVLGLICKQSRVRVRKVLCLIVQMCTFGIKMFAYCTRNLVCISLYENSHSQIDFAALFLKRYVHMDAE
jgi:hypothetical protein